MGVLGFSFLFLVDEALAVVPDFRKRWVSCAVTVVERGRDNLQGFKQFHLKMAQAKARI